MAVERVSGGSSLIDVLDRILDKGMVIDAWVRISLVGIDLITVEARVGIASIDTYLKYAEAVRTNGPIPRPAPRSGGSEGGAGPAPKAASQLSHPLVSPRVPKRPTRAPPPRVAP